MTPDDAPPLVLASGSRYRRELLDRLALPYTAIATNADETPLPDEPAHALVARLAELKARALPAQDPAAVVIGSDQVAVNDGRILGKPGDHATAAGQLAAASGRQVDFLTGVCVMDQRDGSCQRWLDRTRVQFRELSAEEIERYLQHEQPYDCAGSFKCEGLGISLFSRIENDDVTALMGLPLIWLSHALRQSGFRVP